MRRLRNVLILTLVLSMAVTAYAKDASTDYTKGILDRDAVIEAGKTVTSEVYPNADYVLVDDHIRVRYNADGTSKTWDDTYVKVLTESGKRQHQSVSLHYTLPYGTAEVTFLEVIKPDGTATAVNVAEQSSVMVWAGQTYMNIYNPNHKTCEVGVPGVEIGDIVHYVISRDTVKQRMPNAWHDYELFEHTSPIKHFVYEVMGPKELPLKHAKLRDPIEDTVAYTKTETDGLLHHRWEAADVPRMYFEPSMPSLSQVVQRVRVSTIGEWQEVSRWYWNLCEPHIKDTTPEMADKVAELTKGLTERQAKIEAIFRWVSQKVRYMGITTETEAPGHEPHDVSITFENKYGVCRDKAALLVAMLRLGGFDAEIVSIHAGTKMDPDVPTPYFNHAITAVREPDGSWQLMDSTDENTKRLLPAYLSDKSFLVSTKSGETLATSPIIPAEENLVRVETTGELTAGGDLTLQSIIRFDGIEDNYCRTYFARIKPDERRKYFEQMIKEAAAGATLTGCEITPADVQDTSQPLVVRLTWKAGDFLISGGQCSAMRAPFIGASLGTVNYTISYSTGLDKRKYPLRTRRACGIRETLTIALPDGLSEGATMPQFTAIDDKKVSWKKSLRLTDGALVGASEFLMKAVEFSPAEYLQLKDYLRTIEYNQRKMPLLAASPAKAPGDDLIGPEDDVIVLDRRRVYRLQDARNWTLTESMTKKILTYAGTKDHAELKLSYNPAWEEVKLVRATVTAADGTVKSVREEEMNLMDAEWVSAAPRYPAGKMLVISLPNVDVGSVINYEVERTYRDRPFFSAAEIFAGFDPIVSKLVQIHAPTDLKLTIKRVAAERLTATRRTEGATTIYEWAITNQPGMKSERSMPPLLTFAPAVRVSAGRWAAYAKEVNTVFEAAAGDSKAAVAKTRELVEGLDGDDAKMIAIRDFVAKTIRPLGYSAYFEPSIDELPLTTITAADRVLSDAYGSATDRAVLLTAMLREAGLKPKFVLASSLRDIQGLHDLMIQCPETDSFTIALVRAATDAGDVYLNDSDQYGALGTTEHDGGLGLDVATGEFKIIAAAPDKRAGQEITYDIRLSADGDAKIVRGRRWRGETFGFINRMYSEMTPEERRRSHMESIARISQSAKADGELVTDFTQYPAVGKLPVVAEKYAVRDGDHLYLTLPEDMPGLSLPGTDEREHDVYWRRPDRQTGRVTIEAPEEFAEVLLAPADIDWQAPADAGHVRVRVTQEANPPRLVIEYDIDLKAAVIPASEYDKLLEIDRLLSHPRMRTVVLRKKKVE